MGLSSSKPDLDEYWANQVLNDYEEISRRSLTNQRILYPQMADTIIRLFMNRYPTSNIKIVGMTVDIEYSQKDFEKILDKRIAVTKRYIENAKFELARHEDQLNQLEKMKISN